MLALSPVSSSSFAGLVFALLGIWRRPPKKKHLWKPRLGLHCLWQVEQSHGTASWAQGCSMASAFFLQETSAEESAEDAEEAKVQACAMLVRLGQVGKDLQSDPITVGCFRQSTLVLGRTHFGQNQKRWVFLCWHCPVPSSSFAGLVFALLGIWRRPPKKKHLRKPRLDLHCLWQGEVYHGWPSLTAQQIGHKVVRWHPPFFCRRHQQRKVLRMLRKPRYRLRHVSTAGAGRTGEDLWSDPLQCFCFALLTIRGNEGQAQVSSWQDWSSLSRRGMPEIHQPRKFASGFASDSALFWSFLYRSIQRTETQETEVRETASCVCCWVAVKSQEFREGRSSQITAA